MKEKAGNPIASINPKSESPKNLIMSCNRPLKSLRRAGPDPHPHPPPAKDNKRFGERPDQNNLTILQLANEPTQR